MAAKRFPKRRKRTLRTGEKCVLLGALGSAALVAMGQVPAGLEPMQDYLSGRMIVMGSALVGGSAAGVLAGKAMSWLRRHRRAVSNIQTWRRPVGEAREIYHG